MIHSRAIMSTIQMSLSGMLGLSFGLPARREVRWPSATGRPFPAQQRAAQPCC
jgi:hypothetical protein